MTMTFALLEKADVLTVDFRRKRAPTGGRALSSSPSGARRAGQMNRERNWGAVKRRAWPISPASVSLARTRPGKTGRPAESADAQPPGRKSLEVRSKTAPLVACQADPSL